MLVVGGETYINFTNCVQKKKKTIGFASVMGLRRNDAN
jgi:hypothetical protein